MNDLGTPGTRGDQSRSAILDAARRLFIRHGFHGTSMRAIARAAGDRAVAGLYNHFPTKEAIFEALIEERNPYDELLDALEGALAGVTTGPEYLRAALRTVLNLMPRHFDFIQLAQIDLREFEGKSMRHVLGTQMMPRIMVLIQRLQTLPGMKPMDPIIWLRLMVSLVLGYIITSRLGGSLPFGDYTDDEWANVITDALLYGIALPGESPHPLE
jgi:AcrR family transcriptional regulator